MLLTLIPLGLQLTKIKRQHYKTKVLENKWVNIIEDDYICCNVPAPNLYFGSILEHSVYFWWGGEQFEVEGNECYVLSS